MAKPFQQIRLGYLSTESVKARTGKTWEEWCTFLDKAGCRMMDHREIATVLHKQGGLSDWWSSMVAGGYAKERGIQASPGNVLPGPRYRVTLNKMVPVPLDAVWAAWHDPATRAGWLPDAEFQISDAVPSKIMHLDWPDETRTVVRFSERLGRTNIAICHSNLPAEDSARLHKYWDAALDRLQILMGVGNRDTLI
jgi:hypothetical protein